MSAAGMLANLLGGRAAATPTTLAKEAFEGKFLTMLLASFESILVPLLIDCANCSEVAESKFDNWVGVKNDTGTPLSE